MKKYCFSFSILLFSLLLFTHCLNNNNENRAKSKIYINSPVDWGESMAEDTIKMTTVFHNSSNRDIYIHYIATPCGCITVVPESEIIKQNDSVLIDVRYKPAAGETGYIENNIFVHLKNNREPAHFVIRGRIKRQN